MNKESMQETVRAGYDKGNYASVYRSRLSLNPFEDLFFSKLIGNLKQGAKVLDIGSGPGIPYDLHLTEKELKVTGIDISEKHISIARKNVPLATYILGDFLNHRFSNDQFDAIMFLYTLFHIPRDQHKWVISKIASILKPNGYLLITVGTENIAYKEKTNFCGSNMAWSYFDAQTNMDIISQCGFAILESLNEKNYGSDEKHFWILATKKS